MEDSQEVVYSIPKKSKRFLAMFVDFAIFGIFAFFLFGAMHVGFKETDFFKNFENNRNSLRLESNLYVYNANNQVVLITDYLVDNQEYPSYASKKDELRKRIDNFYNNKTFIDSDTFIVNYNERRLNATSNGIHLFIETENKQIIENNAANPEYIYNFYVTEVTNYCSRYVFNNPAYGDYTRFIFLTGVVEGVIAVTISFIIFFIIFPMFIFYRGRQTIGRKIFKIGLVGANALNVSKRRFLCRELFSLFAMVYVNFATILIPLLISLFLIFFSKNSQSLIDYVTATYQIDVTVDDVYLDYGDYISKKEQRSSASIENNDYKISRNDK